MDITVVIVIRNHPEPTRNARRRKTTEDTEELGTINTKTA